ITSVDSASKAPRQRCDLRTDGEFSTRAGSHQPDALYADDLGGLGPLAPAHMHLGVIDAECHDFDDDMTGLGLGFWKLRVDETVRPAEFLDDDGTHDISPVSDVICSLY